jgi:CheY-like chemotaxis protein
MKGRERRPEIRYCPHCRADQPTYELLQDTESVVRCGVCGFPVQEAHPPSELAVPAANRILCIDDEPFMLKLLTEALTGHGFVAVTAQDGRQGLALAASERPLLVLVDLVMPEMDGYEVCRRLKADPQTRDIPLVILTGHRDPKLNIKAFQAGADLALTKPFQPETLIATLRAALALKQRRPSA